jgi:hypothetical protein
MSLIRRSRGSSTRDDDLRSITTATDMDCLHPFEPRLVVQRVRPSCGQSLSGRQDLCQHRERPFAVAFSAQTQPMDTFSYQGKEQPARAFARKGAESC